MAEVLKILVSALKDSSATIARIDGDTINRSTYQLTIDFMKLESANSNVV